MLRVTTLTWYLKIMWHEIESKQQRAKQKETARKLRKTNWWKGLLSKGLCHYCGENFSAELLTMDHKIPLARGGKSSKNNIVAACKDCNSSKNIQTPIDILLK